MSACAGCGAELVGKAKKCAACKTAPNLGIPSKQPQRGYVSWNPRQGGDALTRLRIAQAVIAEYRDHLPLTNSGFRRAKCPHLADIREGQAARSRTDVPGSDEGYGSAGSRRPGHPALPTGSARRVRLPSLSTSGETLTIEESMTLRARTENAGHVGDEHEWSWSSG